MPKSDLSCCIGQRVACSLGSKGRRSRQACVHFNDPIVEIIRRHCILHITLAYNTQMPYDLDCRRPEHMIFLVTQGLTWGHDDAVTRMRAKGIKVLHITNSDTIVVSITHHLVF